MSSLAKTQRALKAKALVWTATSDEACALAVSAMLGRKKLGSLTKPLTPGAITRLKLRLSKSSQGLLRKALKKRKKVTVVLKGSCVDAAGNKSSSTKKLVVKR